MCPSRLLPLAAVALFASLGGAAVAQSGSAALERPEKRSGTSGKIAFVRTGAGPRFPSDIYVMNGDGTGVRRLTRTERLRETSPSWSPDGRKIAFQMEAILGFITRSHGIWVMNADGSDVRRLSPQGSDTDPAWSPDGRTIAFVRSRDIFVMNSRGGAVRRLSRDDPQDSTSPEDRAPTWSPDGSRILFSRGIDSDLYVMNADGRQVRRLTSTPWSEEWPDWSSDGRVAYNSSRDDPDPLGIDFGIYVMNADGSGQRRLTDLGSTSPVCRPTAGRSPSIDRAPPM